MAHVPAATPVTTPALDTVQNCGALDVQLVGVTELELPLEYVPEADRGIEDLATTLLAPVMVIDDSVTEDVTVTVQYELVMPLVTDSTLHEPAATAVIRPELVTEQKLPPERISKLVAVTLALDPSE
jgi:hypothetical protein